LTAARCSCIKRPFSIWYSSSALYSMQQRPAYSNETTTRQPRSLGVLERWPMRLRSLPVRNESAPIQLAQSRCLGLAICNAKILIYFSHKIHGSNFIKQHSETVMVWHYQNADCSLRKKFIVSFTIIFGTLSSPVDPTRDRGEASGRLQAEATSLLHTSIKNLFSNRCT